MTAQALGIAQERVNTARACAIVGISERRLQQKAERGEIPGAVKIDGLWTFHEAKLRAWLDDLENKQCQSRKSTDAANPRKTPSGVEASFSDAKRSTDASGGGRYEQAMSSLLAPASKKTLRASRPRRSTGTAG
jgi:hypothetical protein